MQPLNTGQDRIDYLPRQSLSRDTREILGHPRSLGGHSPFQRSPQQARRTRYSDTFGNSSDEETPVRNPISPINRHGNPRLPIDRPWAGTQRVPTPYASPYRDMASMGPNFNPQMSTSVGDYTQYRPQSHFSTVYPGSPRIALPHYPSRHSISRHYSGRSSPGSPFFPTYHSYPSARHEHRGGGSYGPQHLADYRRWSGSAHPQSVYAPHNYYRRIWSPEEIRRRIEDLTDDSYSTSENSVGSDDCQELYSSDGYTEDDDSESDDYSSDGY